MSETEYKIDFKGLSIQDLAKQWINLDKNPTTLEKIDDLLKNKDYDTLESLLREPITFGTAGLRARMDAGFSCMNDLTVIQASQGLSQYVLKTVENAVNRGVVIGYDHRYNSERFAKLSAAAFLTKGFKVYLYRKLVHTPMVPFAIKELDASCGIMITASHNPKLDNGYKVYWENACQIVEPHDAGIAKEIAINTVPWSWDAELCDKSELCFNPYDEMLVKYFEKVKELSLHNGLLTSTFNQIPKFVYTPMHGVGGPYAKKAFEVFNVPNSSFLPVPQQYEPNPDFPTVKFPNPEEKGALDLALEHATKEGANYVLANDPDADRFACAEKLDNGKWFMFSGNQIGTLLAAQVWEKHGGKVNKPVMLASTVSSKMLKSMGQSEGFEFTETLTGFKWLGNRAIQLKNQGSLPLFAYEEAIGFMVGDVVRDKDGVSAMMTFVELATRLRAEGKTVYSYLMELYHKYGIFVNFNSYYLSTDTKVFKIMFDRLRYGETPKEKSNTLNIGDFELSYPTTAFGLKVTRIRDLTLGYDTSNANNNYEPDLPTSSSTQMITFELKHTDYTLELTLRTSGTEPKLKFYSELKQMSSSQGFDIGKIEAEYEELKKKIKSAVEGVLIDLLKPQEFGLVAA